VEEGKTFPSELVQAQDAPWAGQRVAWPARKPPLLQLASRWYRVAPVPCVRVNAGEIFQTSCSQRARQGFCPSLPHHGGFCLLWKPAPNRSQDLMSHRV